MFNDQDQNLNLYPGKMLYFLFDIPEKRHINADYTYFFFHLISINISYRYRFKKDTKLTEYCLPTRKNTNGTSRYNLIMPMSLHNN